MCTRPTGAAVTGRIAQHINSQWTAPASPPSAPLPLLLLRDENLPNRMRAIAPFLQVPRQCSQPPVHPERIDVRDRLAVHPGRAAVASHGPARRLRARRRATPCRSESRTGSPELLSLSHVAPSGVAELSPRLLAARGGSRVPLIGRSTSTQSGTVTDRPYSTSGSFVCLAALPVYPR